MPLTGESCGSDSGLGLRPEAQQQSAGVKSFA